MNQDLLVGKNLLNLRRKLGLTHEQVAEYLSITCLELSYYETGECNIPIFLMAPLANLFGVDEYDFYEKELDLNTMNLALPFGVENIKTSDLEQIAQFNKIVRNYLGMKLLFLD